MRPGPPARSGALATLALLVLLNACGTGSDGTPGSPQTAALEVEGINWKLDSLTIDEERADAPFRSDLTLEVSGGGVSGNVGCNSYGTSWASEGSRVTVGQDLIVSVAACTTESDAAERLLLDGLPRIVGATREGSRLVLTGPDVQLRFTS